MPKRPLFVLCYGNPYLEEDNLAPRIADILINKPLPGIEFIKCVSPDEILHYIDKDFVILDVVKDTKRLVVIDDIERLDPGSMFSLHDFDLCFFLKLLKETGKIEKVTIIGLPQHADVNALAQEVRARLEGFRSG